MSGPFPASILQHRPARIVTPRCAPAPRVTLRSWRRSGVARTRGFTLIEIIAVIMLIALILTVVSVSVGSGLSGARVSAAGRELVAAMRHTRGQAIVKRESQVFSIDLENRRYTAPGRKETELPKDMEIRVLTAREELIDDGTAGIRFFPDGSSTGGRVTLLMGEREWIIEVQWLTGEVVLFQPGSGSG
jgi:general secretion pathway protein H